MQTSGLRAGGVAIQDYHHASAVFKLPLCYLIFFFFPPRREIKGRSFPSPPHLDQISGRFLVNHMSGTFEDYGHSSLAASVSLCVVFVALGKAAGVTDEQHLILTDHYMWVSFPICVTVCNES